MTTAIVLLPLVTNVLIMICCQLSVSDFSWETYIEWFFDS